MPIGETYINGQDAYTTWGISLDKSALSALMTPAPMKDMIENKSALENGKRVIRSGRKFDERTLTLGFNIIANSEEEFLNQYVRFCNDVLSKGGIDISTKYQPNITYHLDYVSCTQFGEYRTMAKFSLRVIEPNPTNRKEGVDSWLLTEDGGFILLER